jgi:hypothetical protein
VSGKLTLRVRRLPAGRVGDRRIDCSWEAGRCGVVERKPSAPVAGGVASAAVGLSTTVGLRSATDDAGLRGGTREE